MTNAFWNAFWIEELCVFAGNAASICDDMQDLTRKLAEQRKVENTSAGIDYLAIEAAMYHSCFRSR